MDSDTHIHRPRLIGRHTRYPHHSVVRIRSRPPEIQSGPLDSWRGILHLWRCTIVRPFLPRLLDVKLICSAARIPESWAPGRFDYFGSSHQIFHVFVLLGAWSQYLALRGMVWSRHEAVGA